MAIVAMSATGPLLLCALRRLVPDNARRPSRLLADGLSFLPVWAGLVSHAGQLDDVLTLTFAVAALHVARPVAHVAPISLHVLAAACRVRPRHGRRRPAARPARPAVA
ncbi:hypothetical protein OG417_47515 [Actinoallomurus sp. NBC_01490]|uniref:hypothetical protein n=1 Tax=Actinoallomurus sp. NBC_01490 TaxID=2903557 RepID=UPI002E301D9B|nr:hypothetical protein [Actinoallomurus sp. NBC_01490]